MPADDRMGRDVIFSGKHSRWAKGFTLIELLVTLAVLGFVITALYTFYLAGLQGWNRSIDHMEYQQSARIAMDKMITELRYAHLVEIRHDNNEIIYFKINIAGKSTLFRFRLSSGQLLFEQRTDLDTHYAYNVVALGISELTFSIDETETVFIMIRAGDESNEIILCGSIRPRNLPRTESGS